MSLIDTLAIAFTEHDVRDAWISYLAELIRESKAIGAMSVHFVFSDRPRLTTTFATGAHAADIEEFLVRYAGTPHDSAPNHDGAWNAPVVAFSHPLLPAKVYVAGEDRDTLSRAITSLPDTSSLLHALTQSFHALRAHHAALRAQALFDATLPTLLVDKDGRIHALNRHAQPFFDRDGSLLHEDDRGVLVFKRPKLNRDFQTHLAAYFDGHPITRKVRGNDMVIILNGTTTDRHAPPQLVRVTLKRLGQMPHVDVTELQNTLGLTPAQARLAQAMILGETVRDYAARTGLTHKGAKYHLENMMRRLHCKRRDALVRLLVAFAG